MQQVVRSGFFGGGLRRKILASVMSASLVGSFMVPTAALAGGAEGEGSTWSSLEIYDRSNPDDTQTFYLDDEDASDELEGAVYDKASNTLTLTNFNRPAASIDATGKGTDFTIEVVGNNAVRDVWVYDSSGDPAGLHITGEGSIDIDASDSDTIPIAVSGNFYKPNASKLVVDSSVKVKLIGSEEYEALARISDTTVGESNEALQFNGTHADISQDLVTDDYESFDYNPQIEVGVVKEMPVYTDSDGERAVLDDFEGCYYYLDEQKIAGDTVFWSTRWAGYEDDDLVFTETDESELAALQFVGYKVKPVDGDGVEAYATFSTIPNGVDDEGNQQYKPGFDISKDLGLASESGLPYALYETIVPETDEKPAGYAFSEVKTKPASYDHFLNGSSFEQNTAKAIEDKAAAEKAAAEKAAAEKAAAEKAAAEKAAAEKAAAEQAAAEKAAAEKAAAEKAAAEKAAAEKAAADKAAAEKAAAEQAAAEKAAADKAAAEKAAAEQAAAEKAAAEKAAAEKAAAEKAAAEKAAAEKAAEQAEKAAAPAAGAALSGGSGATKASYTVSKPYDAKKGYGELVYKRAMVKKSAKKATVPATTEIDGKTYRVVGIADKAFRDLPKLKTVKVGKYVKKVGKWAFKNSKNVTKLTGFSGVTELGRSAFYGLKKVKKVPSMPKLKKIGAYAFRSCTALKSYTVGKKVSSIGQGAFKASGVTKLTVKSKKLKSKKSVSKCLSKSKVKTVKLSGLGSSKSKVKKAFKKYSKPAKKVKYK